LAHQEEVVLLTLFAAFRFALVFAKLAVAQALEGFAFASRLLKDFLLLIPQCLKPHEFPLHGLPLLQEILST